jgi:hypothetical protein
MTDQTPQTEAGRQFAERLSMVEGVAWPQDVDAILAIEAEAADNEAAIWRSKLPAIEAQARTEALDVVVAALTSEDELAHGEAFEPSRGGLGVCAYCERPWPCHTQQAIDRLLSRLAAKADR